MNRVLAVWELEDECMEGGSEFGVCIFLSFGDRFWLFGFCPFWGFLGPPGFWPVLGVFAVFGGFGHFERFWCFWVW